MTEEIESVQRELYQVIDDGGDPGPLTLKLSKLRQEAGLVEQVTDDDPAPSGGAAKPATFRYIPSGNINRR